MGSAAQTRRFCIQRPSPDEIGPSYFVPLVPLDILPPYISVPGFPRCVPVNEVGTGIDQWSSVGLVPPEATTSTPSFATSVSGICSSSDSGGNSHGPCANQKQDCLSCATASKKAWHEQRKAKQEPVDEDMSHMSLASCRLGSLLGGSKDLNDPDTSQVDFPFSHERHAESDVEPLVLSLRCMDFGSNIGDNNGKAIDLSLQITPDDDDDDDDEDTGNYTDDDVLTLSDLHRQGHYRRGFNQNPWPPATQHPALEPTIIGLHLSSSSSIAGGSDVSASIEGYSAAEGGVSLFAAKSHQSLALETSSCISPGLDVAEANAAAPRCTGINSSVDMIKPEAPFEQVLNPEPKMLESLSGSPGTLPQITPQAASTKAPKLAISSTQTADLTQLPSKAVFPGDPVALLSPLQPSVRSGHQAYDTDQNPRRGGRNRKGPSEPGVQTKASTGVQPPTKKKKKAGYCRGWCRTGDCSYGNACIYEHSMPTSSTDLRALGFTEVPDWYSVMSNLPRTGSQGQGGYMADGRQRPQSNTTKRGGPGQHPGKPLHHHRGSSCHDYGSGEGKRNRPTQKQKHKQKKAAVNAPQPRDELVDDLERFMKKADAENLKQEQPVVVEKDGATLVQSPVVLAVQTQGKPIPESDLGQEGTGSVEMLIEM
ncbi:hypothetical protein BROUX41_000870 [Berkeleyomyces rouxiae]|uniref:uncharacterized protein n=1 Tax=Berkeleyomyces rouxiae TaxID=2035830 RepID=UPI003B821940